jgi:hypothetical protein
MSNIVVSFETLAHLASLGQTLCSSFTASSRLTLQRKGLYFKRFLEFRNSLIIR